MEAHGIDSDSELARRVGVRRSNVGGWLKGEYRPRGANLGRLAELFNVSEAYILGLDESSGMNSAASTVSLALAAVKRARAELDAVIVVLEEQLTPTESHGQVDQADEGDDDGPSQSPGSPTSPPAPKPSSPPRQGKVVRKGFRRPPGSSTDSEQATS
jgi:transcriptional regulator with XRE-family HTH domain